MLTPARRGPPMNETRSAETDLVVHWVPTLGKLVPLRD
jgi:hypothetical protein